MRAIGRLILAILISQLLAGVSAGVSAILFLSNSIDDASKAGFLFLTFGAIFLVPSVFVVEMLIYIWQLNRSSPSLILQMSLSAICGTSLSYVILAGDKSNVIVADVAFSISTGLVGGILIGMAWYFLVTRPTHEIERPKYLKRFR